MGTRVRIRVRIGLQHSPCVPLEVTKWGGPSDETGKTEARVATGVARQKPLPAQRL
jgi:hypothetical protein